MDRMNVYFGSYVTYCYLSVNKEFVCLFVCPPTVFFSDSLETFRCLDHTLKMCMWFGFNPQMDFCHLFRNLNLAVFQAIYNESEWTVPCVHSFSYNFIPVLLKLYK